MLLRSGPETLQEWLAQIERAGRWVHLENYIFWPGGVGDRFAEALCERARAGVAVRVLVDWFGSSTAPRSFWGELRAAGAEVRMVSPPTLGSPLKVAFRDHRKVLAVDGDYASTGGICIADAWVGRSPQTGLPYRDTALEVRGPAVAALESAFAEMWEEAGEPLPTEERPPSADVGAVGEVALRVVAQSPGTMRTLRLMEAMALLAEHRLWITDPYFLSTPRLDRSLIDAARQEVDVRILLPAATNHPSIDLLVRARYRRLLQAGVLIHEYDGPMMHAKTSVADGHYSRVGSTNLNVASLFGCWELDLLVEDTGFGAQMEQMFEQDLTNAREVRRVSAGTRPSAGARGARYREPRVVADPAWCEPSESVHMQPYIGDEMLAADETLPGGGFWMRLRNLILRAVTRAVVLGASLLGLRFLRLLGQPLTSVGVAASVSGLLRLVRRSVGRIAKEAHARYLGGR